MNAAEFIQIVARPNVEELQQNPDDLRFAANAFLSVDALVGLMALGDGPGSNTDGQDKRLRDKIAAQSPAFRLLRDMSFALKHGRLEKREPPRLVSHSDGLKDVMPGWSDLGRWSDSAIWTERLAAVELDVDNGGVRRVRADVVAEAALAACEAHLRGEKIAEAPLPELSHSGILQPPNS